MGWYTHYEIDFTSPILWDDIVVKHALKPYTCKWIYLTDFSTQRIILSCYSSSSITDILRDLYNVYSMYPGLTLKYREYTTDTWLDFTTEVLDVE